MLLRGLEYEAVEQKMTCSVNAVWEERQKYKDLTKNVFYFVAMHVFIKVYF